MSGGPGMSSSKGPTVAGFQIVAIIAVTLLSWPLPNIALQLFGQAAIRPA